jgi:hypothetical protein
VPPVVAAVAGNLAERGPTRYSNLAGAAQHPIVKQFPVVMLPFGHEDPEQYATGHDHSLREVAIPRTVANSDPAKWLVT